MITRIPPLVLAALGVRCGAHKEPCLYVECRKFATAGLQSPEWREEFPPIVFLLRRRDARRARTMQRFAARWLALAAASVVSQVALVHAKRADGCTRVGLGEVKSDLGLHLRGSERRALAAAAAAGGGNVRVDPVAEAIWGDLMQQQRGGDRVSSAAAVRGVAPQGSNLDGAGSNDFPVTASNSRALARSDLFARNGHRHSVSERRSYDSHDSYDSILRRMRADREALRRSENAASRPPLAGARTREQSARNVRPGSGSADVSMCTSAQLASPQHHHGDEHDGSRSERRSTLADGETQDRVESFPGHRSGNDALTLPS